MLDADKKAREREREKGLHKFDGEFLRYFDFIIIDFYRWMGLNRLTLSLNQKKKKKRSESSISQK